MGSDDFLEKSLGEGGAARRGGGHFKGPVPGKNALSGVSGGHFKGPVPGPKSLPGNGSFKVATGTGNGSFKVTFTLFLHYDIWFLCCFYIVLYVFT